MDSQAPLQDFETAAAIYAAIEYLSTLTLRSAVLREDMDDHDGATILGTVRKLRDAFTSAKPLSPAASGLASSRDNALKMLSDVESALDETTEDSHPHRDLRETLSEIVATVTEIKRVVPHHLRSIMA